MFNTVKSPLEGGLFVATRTEVGVYRLDFVPTADARVTRAPKFFGTGYLTLREARKAAKGYATERSVLSRRNSMAYAGEEL